MISEKTREAWRDEVRFLTSHQEALTPWELRFLGNVADLIDRGIDITFRQSKTLRRIYRREQARIG